MSVMYKYIINILVLLPVRHLQYLEAFKFTNEEKKEFATPEG